MLEKNLLDTCAATVGWYVFGWMIACGNVPEKGFAGTENFLSQGFMEYTSSGVVIPDEGNSNLNWFFQWAFCATSATIVSGAVAERLKIGGYTIFCFIMTSFIYPCVVAWTWSCTGWLNFVNGAAYMDFAGSGIVHLCGGTGALVAALIIGPRSGRFQEGVDQVVFEPHNVAFMVLGTFILWFGWSPRTESSAREQNHTKSMFIFSAGDVGACACFPRRAELGKEVSTDINLCSCMQPALHVS